MANALYGKGREAFADKRIDWDTDTIKVVLIDTGVYTVSIDTHDFIDDITGIVGTAETLTSTTNVLGTCDAADVVFTAVSGATVEALVIYRDSGTPGTSELIAYIDTDVGGPISVIPNGTNITITWDNGADKIFTL